MPRSELVVVDMTGDQMAFVAMGEFRIEAVIGYTAPTGRRAS